MRTLLTHLWKHISRKRRIQLGILFCVMLVASFAELFSVGMVIPFLGVLTTPELMYEHWFVRPVVVHLGLKNPQDLLLPTTLTFGVAVILAAIIRFYLVWLQARVSMGIVTEMAVETYWRTLHQPYAFHIARNSSEIISSILNKVGGGIGATIGPLLVLISSALITVTILVALILFNPVVALSSFLGFSTVYTIIVFLTKKRLARDSLKISQASNEVIKVLQEGLGGIRDILLDGTQTTYCSTYRNADVELRNAQASIQIISSAPKFVIESLGIVVIAVIAYSFSTKPGGVVTVIPLLGALAVGAQKLLPLLQQAYSSWVLILGAREPLRDVLDLLDHAPPEISDDKQHRSEIVYKREIRLEHISFRYTPQSPCVLRDICLTLPKGGRIGFIGTTGSGKSTLLDILMGLLQPTAGSLVIDEVVLTAANQRAWQARIAHVPQAIFLSDGTIAENIAFGLPRDEVDLERVKAAARQAQISGAIESWREQYDTLVGERGVRLSGGQRQRIGIARALYKQADVIIFDEATSALDNETERAVMQAIDGLGDHLTILIVAHRLTTLRNCTQIVELQNGELKQIGSYAGIIEKSGQLGA